MYIGMVAEWNPFHTGHAEMIQKIRTAYPAAHIAACMSGSFVQRGEPALFDKWSRARWALQNGIDIVTELPVLYALQSADQFAENGIKILHALGCQTVAFGTESLSVPELGEMASFAMSSDFAKLLHAFIHKDKLPYGQAITKAFSAHSPQIAQELTRPNNLLGLRYILSSLKNHYTFKFIAVPRDLEHPVSASQIRTNLVNRKDSIHLPESTKENVLLMMQNGHYCDMERYNDACLLHSRLADLPQLSKTGLFSEGLENRWTRLLDKQIAFDHFLNELKNKRYLYSHLKRLSAQLLLTNTSPSLFADPFPPQYIRLLGLRKSKSFLLQKTSLPLITKTASAFRHLGAQGIQSLNLDIKSTDIASFCFKNPKYRTGHIDYYSSPIVVNE